MMLFGGEWWAVPGAGLMGITLGLIGGGGSILTVPLLVYGFAIPGASATLHSLFVVGTAAAAGAVPYAGRRGIDFESALLFYPASLVGVTLARRWALPSVPDTFDLAGLSLSKDLLVLGLFAAVMIAASWSMLRKPGSAESAPPQRSLRRIGMTGLGVGALTGFVGAGGGFLIVPALVNRLGLPMERAVGTSLLIIALNSLSGFSVDLLRGAAVRWDLLFLVTGAALIGIFAGTSLSKRIPGTRLKPAFGWFVLIMGSLMMFRQIHDIISNH